MYVTINVSFICSIHTVGRTEESKILMYHVTNDTTELHLYGLG